VVETPLLDQAATLIYEDLDKLGGDPLMLPLVAQPIALLYTFQAMVDNGGFRYPLENDFPFSPPYSVFVEAYRRMGANGAADNLEKAISRFPFDNPHLRQEERNEFLGSLSEDDELFLLGDQVCGDDRIWESMEKYVEKNRAELHV
jgi:hypothetical protein